MSTVRRIHSTTEKFACEFKNIEELSENPEVPMMVDFVALKPGTYNGIYFSEESLIRSAHTLTGGAFTIDHGKSVMDIQGMVVDSWWNDELKQIEGKARIDELEIAKRIKNKTAKSLSVEVEVPEKERTYRGMEAKGMLNFLGISLLSPVNPPACKEAMLKNN